MALIVPSGTERIQVCLYTRNTTDYVGTLVRLIEQGAGVSENALIRPLLHESQDHVAKYDGRAKTYNPQCTTLWML